MTWARVRGKCDVLRRDAPVLEAACCAWAAACARGGRAGPGVGAGGGESAMSSWKRRVDIGFLTCYTLKIVNLLAGIVYRIWLWRKPQLAEDVPSYTIQ